MLSLTAALLVSATLGQGAPATFPSPRLAALAFAVENGFPVPQANLVVAYEVRFGSGHNPGPKSVNDRSNLLPLEQTMADSKAVAKLLGIEIRTAWAKDFVECAGTRCAAMTNTHVLVVEEQKNEAPTVRIKLYSPGRKLTSAIVYVQRLENGWLASRFDEKPYTVVVR